MGDDWFILRTSGRFTLSLAATLEADGFDVWTPARTQTIRIPRSNVKRVIRLPMMPSFVFVRSHHLHELLMLSNVPTKSRRHIPEGDVHGAAHRDFSVFRYLDKIPTIRDRHLEPLRTAERKAVPKKDRPRFDRGQKVRVNDGAFEGLVGKVERCKSGYALVIFSDWKRPVQIPTFLLDENEASNVQAARAA